MKPAKRILCVLLAFLMVFTACFMPMAKAAVVETIIAKYGVEILATILIGSGIGFASSDNARSAAAGCYEWISTNAPAAFQELTKWAGVITGNPATLLSTSVGVKFSESFWGSIEGAFSSIVDSAGNIVMGNGQVLNKADAITAVFCPGAFTTSRGDVYTFSRSDVLINQYGYMYMTISAYKNGDFLQTYNSVTQTAIDNQYNPVDYATCSFYPFYRHDANNAWLLFGYSIYADKADGFLGISGSTSTNNMAIPSCSRLRLLHLRLIRI